MIGQCCPSPYYFGNCYSHLSGPPHLPGRHPMLHVSSSCSKDPNILFSRSSQQSYLPSCMYRPHISSTSIQARLTSIGTCHAADNNDTSVPLILHRRIRIVPLTLQQLSHCRRRIFECKEWRQTVRLEAFLQVRWRRHIDRGWAQ